MRFLPKGNSAAFVIAILIGLAAVYLGVRGLAGDKNSIMIAFGGVMIAGGALSLADAAKKRRAKGEDDPASPTGKKEDRK